MLLAILMLSVYIPGSKISALEKAFYRNLLSSILQEADGHMDYPAMCLTNRTISPLHKIRRQLPVFRLSFSLSRSLS